MSSPSPRAIALIGALLLLSACGRRVADPSKVDGVYNCDVVALKGEDGAIDDCDRKACLACVDFCGLDCALQETYPPQYTCPGIGAYTVLDFCPDWGDEPEETSEEATEPEAP